MKLEHLPDDLVEDFSVEKSESSNFIKREKKITDSFKIDELLDDEILEKLNKILGGKDD